MKKYVNDSFSDLFAYQMKIFTFLQEILYENKLDIMKIKKVIYRVVKDQSVTVYYNETCYHSF